MDIVRVAVVLNYWRRVGETLEGEAVVVDDLQSDSGSSGRTVVENVDARFRVCKTRCHSRQFTALRSILD
ncbi:hypothetical protein J6590_093084 [Homalodisca vitripennis]|nr:hypothetical protein J6590_093084 [Homalodisca vitripennis]